jgi:hypothetical protein
MRFSITNAKQRRDRDALFSGIAFVLEPPMAGDDEDLPISYFFYVIGILAVMGGLVVGGFFLLFH